MNQKNLIFKGVLIVILVAILAGIVYLLVQPKSSCANDDSNQKNRDNYVGPTDAEAASLQRLIVLVQPGKRNALVRLPGLDLDAGELLADASLSEQEDGAKIRSRYESLLENSSVTWLTTSDPWIYGSSQAWIAGTELNLSIPIEFPPVFGGGVEDLYIRMIPLLSGLKERLPQCLIDLADSEVPGAPEDVVTFWAYLIGEGVDNLNASTLTAMNLTFGEDCLIEGEPVIGDELFVNVTRAVADLLAPMLSNVMIEVLSLGNPVGASEAGKNSISVYGMSEWHLQLVLMCIRENAWLGKPGHHIVLELYDSMVNVIYGDRTKSISTIEFVRSIALCGASVAAEQ